MGKEKRMALFSDWLSELEYEVMNGDPRKVEVSEVVFDSRKAGPGTVYVAMKGANVDSHQFLPQVISQGTEAVVVEEDESDLPVSMDEIYEGIAVIRVQNSRHALAVLSAERFGNPSREMKIIAVTGTKGKTTTAHMIQQILNESGMKCGIIGTTGIEYGDVRIPTKNTTPESYDLQKCFREMRDSGCTHVVMEASSQGFKLHRTDAILFDYGIFTNIEPDHIGPNEHKDFEEYKFYKSRIFQQSRNGLINIDADYAEEIKAGAACPMLTFGLEHPADFMAGRIQHLTEENFTGLSFHVSGRTELDVKLGMPGLYNVYNALAAISVCTLLGAPKDSILDSLRNIRVNGRMEVVFRNKDMTVLVDYAHNEMSMKNLLETLREYQPKRLVVVFGCGGNRSKDRRYGMGEMAAKYADLSILTADNSRFEKTEDIIADIKKTLVPAGGKYVEIPDRREAIEYAMSHAEKGDMIAVIGKGHEDYQEVHGVRTHFLDREVIQECAEKLSL